MQHTRFKGEQAANFVSLKEAADAYPKSLTEEEQLGFWQKPYDWSEGHVNFLDNMYQLLNAIQAMQLKPAATIIEVGSGAGWTTEVLAALGYKVICLEPAEVMLNAARQRVADFLRLRRMPHLISNVSYHTKTLEEADFLADHCADGMLFFESFHHVIDEHKAVREAFRLLKPTGCLCILGDSNWHPGNQEQERFWLEEMQRFGTLESPFTHGYLEHVLRSNGFQDVQRYHAINTFVPVEEERRPAHNFVVRLNAAYLNLFIARKPARQKPVPADIPVAPEAAEPPALSEGAAVMPAVPVPPQPQTNEPRPKPSAVMSLALALYQGVPLLRPVLRGLSRLSGIRPPGAS